MKLFGIDINKGFLLTAMQAIAQASGLSPIPVSGKNNQAPKTEFLETPDTQKCSASLGVFTEWQHTPQNCELPPMFMPHFDFLNDNTANTEPRHEKPAQTLETLQDKFLSGFPTIRRFPDDIKDDPYFEGSDKPRTKAEGNDFISRQKKEFLEAVQYTEEHILSRSAEDWTPEAVLEDITNLNQILGKTLRGHRLSSTSAKISKEGYRLEDVVSYRACPLAKYSARFNIQNPVDVFLCLSASDKAATAVGSTDDFFASATDFLKWYLKWDKQYDYSFQELEDALKNVVETYGENVEQWRNTHFSGKSLSAWHHDFFENEGKSFKYPEDITGIIKTATTRHTTNGLYTPQELKAVDRVIKIYLPPQEIPQAMRKMANNVVKMIQEKVEPIDIASYIRYAITHEVHPFPNGNGRTASVYINSFLMRFGYPAIPRQTRDIRKRDVIEVRNSPNRYVLYREKLRNRLRDRCQHDLAPACKAFRTKKETIPNKHTNTAKAPKTNKGAISSDEQTSPTKASKKGKTPRK